MTLSVEIGALLPYLRRYARALTGSQNSGDAYVTATLQAIVDAPTEFPRELGVKVGLYRTFHAIWSSAHISTRNSGDRPVTLESTVHERLAHLPPRPRQALILTVLEGFTNDEAAMVLETDVSAVPDLIREAVDDIGRQMATTVLIIEDEPVIALDIEEQVTKLGHRVVGIADTRETAVELARRFKPGLILADIRLADGSSGLDAVNDIIAEFSAPVIFITAYPELLLTGQRPEPTFLITKPFRPETLNAAIGQALFFRTSAKAA